MLKIYHAEGRRSERIVWLCEEISLPYKLEFTPGDLMASMKLGYDVNPLMTMFPIVDYNDEVLVESAAILQILYEKHGNGQLVPDSTSPDYPKYLQWFHFAEGSAAPRLITEFLLKRVEKIGDSQLITMHIGKSDVVLRYLEDYLSKKSYFGGEAFSLADIMMHFNINFISMVAKHDMSPYPSVMAWFDKIEGRPAFKRMRHISLPNGFIGIPD